MIFYFRCLTYFGMASWMSHAEHKCCNQQLVSMVKWVSKGLVILFLANIRVVLTFNSLFVVIQYLSTPIYVMVSQWDSYQLKELILQKYRAIRLPPSSYHEAVYLARFGNNTHRSLRKVSPTQLRNWFMACFIDLSMHVGRARKMRRFLRFLSALPIFQMRP